MSNEVSTADEIAGELLGLDRPVPVQILKAAPHTLFVKFARDSVPATDMEFASLKLQVRSREVALGRCRYLPHNTVRARRKSDPPLFGDGRLAFLDEVYDFSALPRSGMVVELKKQLEQLPVLWNRKKEILPAFREYVGELVYDLQVYRSVFDEVDRNLADEPPEVRAEVHGAVCATEYPAFKAIFDRNLDELGRQVRTFSKEEHERHGFYLRKHVWDLIRASEFLLRTNLKPRGYAGDSQMMRMLYENNFRGPTIFARFMHLHPVQSAAAQAVRNRIGLLSERIAEASARKTAPGPLKFMSVACGPAWELSRLISDREDLDRYAITLLDQDPEALGEARALVSRIEELHGRPLQATFIQESVRTMLRTPNLHEHWGRFHFLYSMGLFDYLTAPVAKVVLKAMYGLLEPGGELVVGNFHVGNRTRTYLEYWMDWVLLHRTEDEMRELASGLEGAEVSVIFENTESQMFLCLRKAP